jgi:hypothetical protein
MIITVSRTTAASSFYNLKSHHNINRPLDTTFTGTTAASFFFQIWKLPQYYWGVGHHLPWATVASLFSNVTGQLDTTFSRSTVASFFFNVTGELDNHLLQGNCGFILFHCYCTGFQGTNSARLCSRESRYDNPIPARFLAPIDCLKILARGSYGFILFQLDTTFSTATVASFFLIVTGQLDITFSRATVASFFFIVTDSWTPPSPGQLWLHSFAE